MCNRDLSVLISMSFDEALSGAGGNLSVVAAFRKVQNIGKGLKSNGNSNKAGFL